MGPDGELRRFERQLPAAGVVALMSLVASLSFRAVFDGWVFVVAPVVAVLAATAIALFASYRKLLLGETVALLIVGYLLVGTIVVGGVPVPASFISLMGSVTNGWVELLDTLPPADASGDLKALPFTAAWVATSVGLEILRRTRRLGLPAVGPLLGLATSILFSVEQRRLVVFQGAVLAVLFLVLVTLQYEARRTSSSDSTKDVLSRIALALLMLTGVAVAGPLLAESFSAEPPVGRVELRQFRPTPWDPLAVPSPLSQLKGSLIGEKSERVAFEIAGPKVDRVQIAVLEEYDGRVWSVAAAGTDASAEFVPAGPSFPDVDPQRSGDLVEHQITLRGLGSHWLPVPGRPDRLEFIVAADEIAPSIQMNEYTGTVAVPRGLDSGMTYTVRSEAAPELDDDALGEAELALDFDRYKLELLPPALSNIAADYVEGVDPGWGQVSAIQTRLREEGFYIDAETPPGHSYYRIAEFLTQLSVPSGYSEQYAAGGAVLARSINLPSRVVVGYRVPADRYDGDTAEVLFGDIDAWMEIETEDYGWVPVDVTPDKTREPRIAAAGTVTKAVASPNPPPPPPTSSTTTTIPLGDDEEIPEEEIEEPEDLEEEAAGFAGLPIFGKIIVLAMTLPFLFILLVAAMIIGIKVLKRRRRRAAPAPSGRIAGAWYEAVDRYREAGFRIGKWATPSETVSSIARFNGSSPASDALKELASQVDRAAFHPEPPSEERAGFAWELSDAAINVVRSEKTTLERVRMALDPAPVVRPSRRSDPTQRLLKRIFEKRVQRVEQPGI